MVRTQIGNHRKATPIAVAAYISTVILFSSLASPAQPSPNPVQPTASSAASAIPSPGSHSVSAALQPSLDTVRRTLQVLRLDRWKKGTVRDEASTNVDSILRDLRVNLPPLLQGADAAPGSVSKLLPVSSHVDALYDVLLRVTEASRVSGPDDQAAQLQQALIGLGDARLALNDRIQGSAGALEKQVIDLRATIERQASARSVAPAPVALPCVPPPAHKTTTRTRKPATKPATTAKPSTTKSATGTSSQGTQPTTTH